jgi:hypothetical protein
MAIKTGGELRQPAVRRPTRRPWLILLAGVVVGFLIYSLPPYVSLDPAQARTILDEGFAWHYPLLVVHITAGSIAMVTVCLQVWPWLRRTYPAVHRTSGRIYVFAGALPASLVSLIILPFTAVPVGAVGAAITAVLWFGTTVTGYVRIRQRRYLEHRRWMIYSFALAISIIWGRIVGVGLVELTAGWNIDPVVYAELAGWLGTVINLFVAQWWLERTGKRPSRVR